MFKDLGKRCLLLDSHLIASGFEPLINVPMALAGTWIFFFGLLAGLTTLLVFLTLLPFSLLFFHKFSRGRTQASSQGPAHSTHNLQLVPRQSQSRPSPCT